MRFRTGLLGAGLAVAVMAGVGGTAAASASARASSAPTVAASWTGKPGCEVKADWDLPAFEREIGKKRLKYALVKFEQENLADNEIDPAEVERLAFKLHIPLHEAYEIIKRSFYENEKPCKFAELDEVEWLARKLGVTSAKAKAILAWAMRPDGEFIEIHPKSRKCVKWAKKVHVSPKRLAAELEKLELFMRTAR